MTKNQIKHLKPIFSLALILSYPLLVLIILGWFLMPSLIGFLREIIAFLLLTLISIALIVLVPRGKLRLWFAGLASSLLTVLCFIKLSFYQNFGVKLSASALFIIFETNATEASDFSSSYLNEKVVGVLMLLVVLLCLSIMQLKRLQSYTHKSALFIKLFSIIGIICSVIVLHHRFSNENLLIRSVSAYTEYTQAKINTKAELAQQISPNIDVTESTEEEKTYVVVIGESTSRWHMQLYGYDRETNPLLTKMKEELLLFSDVITPNVNTTGALDKILTKSDFDKPNAKNNASVVQLANEAGFVTYWISNQQPVGIHDAYASLIGAAASEQFFIAADDYEYDIHDEQLLPVLDAVLIKEPKRKMIFLHLIGTHGRYKRRYPESFDYFKENKTNALFKSKHALNLINEYDNSVRYNDFIISEVINRIKAKNTNSYVLYFSDHGDDVFDTTEDYVGGHNEFKATRPMYEVPFIVWSSKKYRQKYPNMFEFVNTGNPYILEDFMHSFAELNQISFDGLDAKKSIFSAHFERKTRRVINGEIYDKE